MYEIPCYKSNGDTLNYLTQWDLGQILYFHDLGVDAAPTVHFHNKMFKENESVITSGVYSSSTGVVSVEVPNLILQKPYPIDVYIYVEGNNGTQGTTIYTCTIPVRSKAQPVNYQYVDNLPSLAYGAPRGVFATASDLTGKGSGMYIKSATGDTYDGYVYYWNGTTLSDPIILYQAVQLADGSITSAKIGTGEVKEGNINNGAVTENKLGTGAVTTSKIGTGAVTFEKMTIDDPSGLVAALAGYGLAWYESEYKPSVVTGDVTAPCVWHDTTDDVYYIVYDKESNSNGYAYSAYQIPKMITYLGAFTNPTGVLGELAVRSDSPEMFICLGGTSWCQIITPEYLSGNGYVKSRFHQSDSETGYHTLRPTTTDVGQLWEMWWTRDEGGTYICYQLISIDNGSYNWQPVASGDSAPNIFIGTTDKTSTETGTSTQVYHKHDRYINKQNGKIWVCSLAQMSSSVWQYTWVLKGNLFHNQAVYTYTISASNWNNKVQTLNLSSVYTVTSKTKVDVEGDDTVLEQLVIDDCDGIYVENNSGSLTIKAIGNAPTANITVQLVVYEVEDLN